MIRSSFIRQGYDSMPMNLKILIITVVMAITSCNTSDKYEGHIYYRMSSNPTTLDPAHIVDVTGGSIAAKLFNGLVRINENLDIGPDIADSWSISKDGLTYRFRLRQGVAFSNKRYVAAHDFKYSFERILNPKTRSPNTWVLDKIAGADDYISGRADNLRGVRVIDDHTLEIRLARPFSPFLYLLTMPAAYVVPEEEIRRLGPDFSFQPAGTGPFLLREWQNGRTLRLERRDDYFDKKPAVRGLVYRIISEDLTAMAEFELGNIDVIAIPSSHFRKFMDDPVRKGYIHAIRGINTYYLGMNCARPPFDNPEVRRAISHAIDREKLLNTFYEKRGRPASGPLPDLLRKWEASPVYEYNPEKAGEIIKRRGLTGTAATLYITADQEVADMAEFIQSFIKKTGLDLRIKQLEWSAYKEAINKGEPDMFWLSWWADYPDPENFLYPLFHSSNAGPAGNRTRYSSREADRLIELGQAEQDEKKKNAYYQKAERLIVKDAPWVFFWHKTDYIAVQPYVRGFRPYPVYSMDKGTDVGF